MKHNNPRKGQKTRLRTGSGASVLLTEVLIDGQIIEGVGVVNPFNAA